MVVIAALVGPKAWGRGGARARQVNIPMGFEAGHIDRAVGIVPLIASADDPSERRAPECPRRLREPRHRLRQAHARALAMIDAGKTRTRFSRRDRRRARRGGHQSGHRKARSACDGLRLGQVDDPARRQRAQQVARARSWSNTPWRDRCRSAAPMTCACAHQPHRHGVPAICAAALATVAENVGFGSNCAASPSRIGRIVGEEARDGRPVEMRHGSSVMSCRAHAAARRLARAFATDARHPADGRAVLGARPLIRDQVQDELLLLQKDLRKPSSSSIHDSTRRLEIGNRIAILEGGPHRAMRMRGGHSAAARQRYVAESSST